MGAMGLHWALLLVSVGAGWERAHGASAARAPVGAAELLWQSRSHCAGQAPADRPNDLIWFAEEAGAEVRHSRRAGGDPIDGLGFLLVMIASVMGGLRWVLAQILIERGGKKRVVFKLRVRYPV